MDPTNILDFDIHLDRICLAEPDSRLEANFLARIRGFDFDWLLVHTALVFSRDVASCRVSSTEVDDRMLRWHAARFERSPT